MDTFILAATSFTIAVSLLISGKKDKLQASFSGLCAAVFISQTSFLLWQAYDIGFFLKLRYLGALAIAPSALHFFRYLTRNKSLIYRKWFAVFTITSIIGSVFVFTPLYDRMNFNKLITAYNIFALVICYAALLLHVNKLSPGTEKKRLGYLLAACPIALVLSYLDLLNYWALNLPVITGIVLSALLYFILLIVAYPQLRALHEFFGRALVIFVNTVAGAIIFYFAVIFFGGSPPSLTGLLIASFLMTISFSPMKMILRKIFSCFYPGSRDVFTSLYEFDEKLEKEKNAMLAEMAPVVAHEIRNPLGSIKGAAQYLQSEASTEEQKELLNVIIEGTDRLNNVVSQFLDYARPYQLNLKPQNLNVIIKKAVSIIAANKLVETINIIEQLDNNIPDAEVDEQQIMQVILNMALNAIESMPQGGTLIFRTACEESAIGEEINITIQDTGKGITKKEIKDIFKPFFTTKERGTGLGLAICQRIIREHGGSIRVDSIPGQRTVFVIKLKKMENN
jgi:signal transduction histidine kinase